MGCIPSRHSFIITPVEPLACLPQPSASQMPPHLPSLRPPQSITSPLWPVKNSWSRTPVTSERSSEPGGRDRQATARDGAIVATLRVQRRRSRAWHVWIRFLESKRSFHFPKLGGDLP